MNNHMIGIVMTDIHRYLKMVTDRCRETISPSKESEDGFSPAHGEPVETGEDSMHPHGPGLRHLGLETATLRCTAARLLCRRLASERYPQKHAAVGQKKKETGYYHQRRHVILGDA